jgi:hypothetical protein
MPTDSPYQEPTENLFGQDERWLEIVVDETDVIVPRMRLTSVPWALWAAVADSAVVASSESDGDWVIVEDDIYSAVSGNVGIGTMTPREKLQVTGMIHSTEEGFKFPDGTVMTTAATGGTGDGHSLDAADGDPVDVVYVNNEGSVGIGAISPTADLALYVESPEGAGNSGVSVVGLNSDSSNVGMLAGWRYGTGGIHGGTGNTGYLGIAECGAFGMFSNENQGRLGCETYGVWGKADEPEAKGVYGENRVSNHYGYIGGEYYSVYGSIEGSNGYAALMSGTKAVVGYNPDGDGVCGVSVSGMGVYGSSTNNYGVWGQSNDTHGVHGKSWNSLGVYGEHFSSGNYGYLGGGIAGVQGQSASHTGVIGLSTTGTGVLGWSTYGTAGMFQGDVVVYGRTTTEVVEITGGSDLSEQFDVHPPADGPPPKPGMVVCIDPHNPGDLVVSHRAYDDCVAGVISGAGGLQPGMLMGQSGSAADGQNPVALTGRVYCWADASCGPIQPGDLLTTSDTPGHAMKVTDRERSQGAAIGKAMSSLDAGTGLVLVLVNLQ